MNLSVDPRIYIYIYIYIYMLREKERWLGGILLNLSLIWSGFSLLYCIGSIFHSFSLSVLNPCLTSNFILWPKQDAKTINPFSFAFEVDSGREKSAANHYSFSRLWKLVSQIKKLYNSDKLPPYFCPWAKLSLLANDNRSLLLFISCLSFCH